MGRPPSCDCGHCAKCRRREYMRRWYAQRPGYAAEMARIHRGRARAYEREKYRTDPEFRARKRARVQTIDAIRRGIIARGPCEVCGDANAQAHHPDYSKPLEVRWLCDLHHRALHGEHTAIAAVEEFTS